MDLIGMEKNPPNKMPKLLSPTFHTGCFLHPQKDKDQHKDKVAHTGLAVKACLLGGNSHTKCSITFVYIAVAISA